MEKKYWAVATAAHVVRQAHNWLQPIRLHHFSSDSGSLLLPHTRAIILGKNDEAVIVFDPKEIKVQASPTILYPKGETHHFKPGIEIGWMGFPAIPEAGLCFFSGKISSYIDRKKTYLVDGVAINGVSGGPAFRTNEKAVELIGIVTVYHPNWNTGQALPGLAAIVNIGAYHTIADNLKSLEDVEETPPSQATGGEQRVTQESQ